MQRGRNHAARNPTEGLSWVAFKTRQRSDIPESELLSELRAFNDMVRLAAGDDEPILDARQRATAPMRIRRASKSMADISRAIAAMATRPGFLPGSNSTIRSISPFGAGQQRLPARCMLFRDQPPNRLKTRSSRLLKRRASFAGLDYQRLPVSTRVDSQSSMTYYHTMRKAKVALSLEAEVVRRVDELVSKGAFANRSQAVEEALREKLARIDRTRLSEEAAKLDPEQEKRLAEEGIEGELKSWPSW